MKVHVVRLAMLGLAVLLLSQAAVAGDLDGTWNFVFYSDQGEHPRTFVLSQDGAKVTGKRGDETFSGTLQGGKLELEGEHYAEEAGYQAQLKISGKLTDGKIEGTATWDTYELTFKATKAD